ncbi:UDP-glycosyltransferase [Quillaja saponaria]|uniref:UDP-glycosyltransferase n=1 Tax=Quillaja saponaria TaxID=32244 RepID=A0AAD7LKL6_QUISA|nr:UDP-glycosyltransferase [Quillaja saponaria]
MSASFFSMLYHLDLFRQNKLSLLDFPGAVNIPGIPSAHLGTSSELFLMKTTTNFCIFTWMPFQRQSSLSLSTLLAHPYLIYNFNNCTKPADHNRDNHMQWLDSQPACSVLYISFGSHLIISDTQMVEIAAALKSTSIRYFWVAREKENWLKENFGDHTEKGLIVPWCEQLKVLSHSSIGGFWSHCGWNSTLEALFAGVPILTFPLFLDQFPNSKQIVEDLEEWVGRKESRSVGKQSVGDKRRNSRASEKVNGF